MLAISKLTAEGQTTIPPNVRAALMILPGDLVAWELCSDGSATLRRVLPIDIEYLRAVEGALGEWVGAADEAAYRDL